MFVTDLVRQCDFLLLNDTISLRIYKNHMAVTNLVVPENTLDKSDCTIFLILISQKLFEVESLLLACKKISMEVAI